MSRKNGTLSVESENIFPIIKKWLYTEQDIFIRELISNASDAISKLGKLVEMGECDTKATDEGIIDVILNKENKSIKIIDNGLGMDAEEVDKYINQIAFSGAEDFFDQYKNKTDADKIIGHFGLGFYSGFMVASKMTIDSLSWKQDASAVFWECDSQMNYTMSEGNRSTRGTEITLYVESEKLLNPSYIETVIKKYFMFLPISIRLTYEGESPENQQEYGTKTVTDSLPLWNKRPEECKKEEYIDFYKKVFEVRVDPVLWVHLYNEELGVKGIIYFRDEDSMNQSIDGKIKLFSNQVFITDNAKGVIPDFVFLQNGVIDCKELPLMVSRSGIQTDENVGQITNYITEQVAFKIYGAFTCEREFYESIWEHLNPFIKFSCLKDKLFASYVEKFIIFKTLSGRYVTLMEHLEEIKSVHENIIYYVSDDIQQAHYIRMFKKAEVDALYMTHVVDQPYIKKQEVKNTELRFNRIDSNFSDALRVPLTEEQEEEVKVQEEQLKELFKAVFEGRPVGIKADRLITKNVSAVMILDEETRRLRDMIDLYESQGIDVSKFDYGQEILFLNTNNRIIQFILSNNNEAKNMLICRHVYDLARLGQEALEAQDMADFIDRSNEILELIL